MAKLMEFFSKISGIFKAKNDNNLSSMRIAFLGVIAFILYIYFDWQKAFLIEITKEDPNYEGLTKLFLAMMVTFALALLAKVVQKKFEQTDYELYDDDVAAEEAVDRVRDIIAQRREQEEYKTPVKVEGFNRENNEKT